MRLINHYIRQFADNAPTGYAHGGGGIATSIYQTWDDYSTNVIDYNYLPHARLRLRINKITM